MRSGNRFDLIERRLADIAFYLLLALALVLAGWLGARNDRYWDWTTSGRNTLSGQSAAVLDTLDAPLQFTVFIDRDHPLAKGIEAAIAPYRRAIPDLAITYLDPQIFPEQARAAEVSLLGQVLVEYRNRRETISDLSEEVITSAIARLARSDRPWVVFLEGHGERRKDGGAPSDLGRFARILGERGYRLQPLDLATQPVIPENTGLLVVSMPAIALFSGEADRLLEYLEGGGNLLWLMDPGPLNGMEPVADALGIRPLPGKLVDANVSRLDIDDPSVAMVSVFPEHPLTRGLVDPALFPGTRAYLPIASPDWSVSTPLRTLEGSWNETGPISGEISRDGGRGEEPGPLPLALALTREAPGKSEQRVLILGDGDFLSNAQLGSGSNRVLGLRLLQWLTPPEGSNRIPPLELADRNMGLSRIEILVVGGGSLVILPLLFLFAGLFIRWRRRRE